jgi:hypothetical protein
MITVTDIQRIAEDSHVRLQARVSGADYDGFELWFRYPAGYYDAVSTRADPFVAALLLPAMARGATLRIEGPSSARMLQGIGRFMEVICNWWGEFRPVRIETDRPDAPHPASGERVVASSFSGGVDSFYTLLKNEHSDLPAADKISKLIFVHGFDIRLEHEAFYRGVAGRLDTVAKACNKELMQVSTNARQLAAKPATWDRYHGTALIAVALGLQAGIRRLYIPASYPYKDLFPWGSHPLTDPLWSTESLDIVHDGCEATRVEKVRTQVSKSQVALDNLRVCWEDHRALYNCNTCEKCIRTKLNLQIAGVLQACTSFDGKLRYRDIKRLCVYGDHAELFAKDNLEALRKYGGDPRLIKALNTALHSWGPHGRRLMRRHLGKSIGHALKRLVGWEKGSRACRGPGQRDGKDG